MEFEEVKIPLPIGGHIAGKWWGDRTLKPFICLHGYQDNAGSFDRFIPLLPQQFSYLAIDFRGCGKSSKLPNGVNYHFFDNLHAIYCIIKEYKWNKVGFIAHSMGAGLSFVYAALFPDQVEMVINIDWLKPWTDRNDILIDEIRDTIENFVKADQRNQSPNEPPAYTLDEISERMVKAVWGSYTKNEAKFLLERQIAPSKKFPGKFYLTKDARMNYSMGLNLSLNVYLDLAKELKMPFMYIKAKDSSIFEDPKNFMPIVDFLKRENKNFMHVEVDSIYHHVHLVEPEKISGAMSEFMIKHLVNGAKSKL